MTLSTLLLLLLLFFSTSLSIAKGQCDVVRVRQAVQPSLNGYYHLMNEECEDHSVWEQNSNPSVGSQLYIIYGTKSHGPGWVIVNEFCSLDADELAMVTGPYAYPYDMMTYGKWYEMRTNSTWTATSLFLTCDGEEVIHTHDKVITYDVYREDIYHEEEVYHSPSVGAIIGIVLGSVIFCIILCVLVVLLVRRRRRSVIVTGTHVYHSRPVSSVAVSSGPSTTLLIGSAPVANCAVIGPPVYYQPCTSRVVVHQQTSNVCRQSRPPSYRIVSTRR